jgi:hypothetical protein
LQCQCCPGFFESDITTKTTLFERYSTLKVLENYFSNFLKLLYLCGKEEKQKAIFHPAKPNTSDIIYHQAFCSSKKAKRDKEQNFLLKKDKRLRNK